MLYGLVGALRTVGSPSSQIGLAHARRIVSPRVGERKALASGLARRNAIALASHPLGVDITPTRKTVFQGTWPLAPDCYASRGYA